MTQPFNQSVYVAAEYDVVGYEVLYLAGIVKASPQACPSVIKSSQSVGGARGRGR